MSKTVRAKFDCVVFEENEGYENKTVVMTPVVSGSEENKSFSKYTPSGSLQLVISNETEASKFFEVGKQYYLDFKLAE